MSQSHSKVSSLHRILLTMSREGVILAGSTTTRVGKGHIARRRLQVQDIQTETKKKRSLAPVKRARASGGAVLTLGRAEVQ